VTQWKREKVGNTVRYRDIESGRTISRYSFDKIRKGIVQAFTTAGTTHRYIDTSFETLVEDISSHRGKAYSVYLRWLNDEGKYVQTSAVSLTKRKSEDVAADLFHFAQDPSRKAKSKLPTKIPQDDEIDVGESEDTEPYMELVFVSRL
jgi:hypothetical protein